MNRYLRRSLIIQQTSGNPYQPRVSQLVGYQTTADRTKIISIAGWLLKSTDFGLTRKPAEAIRFYKSGRIRRRPCRFATQRAVTLIEARQFPFDFELNLPTQTFTVHRIFLNTLRHRLQTAANSYTLLTVVFHDEFRMASLFVNLLT
jgi:hypothetical protein